MPNDLAELARICASPPPIRDKTQGTVERWSRYGTCSTSRRKDPYWDERLTYTAATRHPHEMRDSGRSA